MGRFLRRWMVVGMVVALLAGACSDGGEQGADEASRSGNAPTTVAAGGFRAGGCGSSRISGSRSTRTCCCGGCRAGGCGSSRISGSGSTRTCLLRGVPNLPIREFPTPVALGEAGSGPEINLTVRLSEARESEGETSPVENRVDGIVLDDEQIRAVIDRLPPWDVDDGDEVDFNRPTEALPPPRTGRTVDQPFPAGPGIAAPVADPGPLEVLRVQPVGEVGLAPYLSITFNQPMVPLATLGQLDGVDVPVEMTPPLPGRWQWIGTRTLRFDHEPADLRSPAHGDQLRGRGP